MQWAGFFIKEMQKKRIDIQREILDDFLNLSYVIKTMSSLDDNIHYRKKLSLNQNDEIQSKKKNMIYKKENDWVFTKEEEEKNVKSIWEKFKKLNINAQSFNPNDLIKNKSLKVQSEAFIPQK